MSGLTDKFALALLDPKQKVPDGLFDGAAQPAGRRFNVYRNNIAVSLTEALRIGFPVVSKLIGRQNMDGLAGIFLRAHPPTSPLMMQYGADFPDFLAGTAQLAHLGYLPDIARLELAIRRSYHAGDAVAIAPECLGEITTQAMMRATFTMAPTVQLVRSDWPIFDIWRNNTDENVPKPQAGVRAGVRAGAQDVLVTRPDFDPLPQLLPPGGAAWITGLMNGLNVEEALDAALTETPGFDLTTPLTLLLQGGALTSLNQNG